MIADSNAPGEIHLWWAALDDFSRELPRLEATLSPDERVRSSRFHRATDCTMFVLCRGILRQLLGRYLGREPSAIGFTYGPGGKPAIVGLSDDRPLYFNASRCGAFAVYAVTSACPLGVDVERLRPVPELEYIATRFFSPVEANTVLTVPTKRQIEKFFACWTRKEAVVKATGSGLALDAKTDTWQFCVFQPAHGYIGTLAYKGAARVLRRRVSNQLLVQQ